MQDVILTDRSGLTTTTGLEIPDFDPVEAGEGAPAPMQAAASGGWMPERVFDWTIQDSPSGTSTLTIRTYPFYYQPQTTDVRFYRNYAFEIQYITSTVEVLLLTTDEHTYAQGQEVVVDLLVHNTGEPQDFLVEAVVWDEARDEIVDGLLLRSLKGMQGLATFSASWSSEGFEPGNYAIEAVIRDTDGNVLARQVTDFRLGISAGEITSFVVSPTSFDIGDPIDISLGFSNTGTVPITGTAIIQVQGESGTVVEEFNHDVLDLAPAHSILLDDTWNTAGAEKGTYHMVAYVLYDARSTEPKVAAVSSLKRVYLPLILRN